MVDDRPPALPGPQKELARLLGRKVRRHGAALKHGVVGCGGVVRS